MNQTFGVKTEVKLPYLPVYGLLVFVPSSAGMLSRRRPQLVADG